MLYIGKPYSDFITACMSIMLFVLIYWFSQKGEISFHFDTKKLCLILLSFWLFTNGWASIFIWIGGATNYLYTSVFILLFLLPYLRYFNNKKLPKDGYLNLFMIVGGLITGCTNENSIPPVLLLLGIILVKNRKNCPLCMNLGFVSMLTGFLIFFTAPAKSISL